MGDPDQSIYRFRYGNSQIGEQAPQNGKQPLNEFVELCKKKRSVFTTERLNGEKSIIS